VDVLDDLRAALHRDPKTVAERASRIVSAARDAGDTATLSRGLAVLGRARRSLGEIDLAEVDLARAVEAAAQIRDDELGADARIGLAGVLSFAGRSEEAFTLLDEAVATGSQRLRAYAALQRAIIEQRLGRLREAVTGYESALPTLRRLEARIDIALVLMNRGVIRTQTGEYAGAIADLTESGELFAAEGSEFGVAQTRHGLGWAHARSGDIPLALQHLDDAAERFGRLGHEALEVDVDRVEVLLSAGLFAAAAELGTRTATRLRAAGNHSQAAEVWLLCARAAVLDGDRSAAGSAARRARALFADQGAVGWEQAAQLEVLRSGSGDPAELPALARRLDAAGNVVGSATALALAALAAAEIGAADQADRLAAECAQRAGRLGLLEPRMQAAHASAACAAARGDADAAFRRIRAALDDLDGHRTSLAASGARASVAVHARALVALGLRMAAATGSPGAVLEWMERGRSGRAEFLAVRPPPDGALAAELAELRAVAARARDPDADGAEALARQAELESSIERRLLRAGADGDPGRGAVPTVEELQSALGGATLVELAEIDERLLAVAVDERGARIADIGAGADVDRCTGSALSALHAAVRAGGSGAGADLLRRALRELDSALAVVLTGDGPMVLVVPPALHVVPWHLLPGLLGRTVSVAPSAAWWRTARSRPAPPGRAPAALVAGPRLDEAEREVLDVARSYADAAVLTGSAATAHAVITALAGATVAHLACHGRIRYDNPLWSSLELVDGPLYVHDLERASRTPPFVVLSGCETGVGVRAGDELLGLSAAFLARGTRSLVAAICPLPDTVATRETMTALHERISRGATPAAALAELSAAAERDEHALLASCLSCFGAE
jgi:tetratricopeptide (TPR) repeat protein